jgi:FKBP-type peptidyl-prolyl cis-trans isomerase FkpA
MKISKLLLFGLLLLAMACSNEKETPKGHKFTVIRKGDGVLAKPGFYLKMNMVMRDGKDSVWNDTQKSEIPLLMQITEDTLAMKSEEGFEEVLRMLSVGDSVVLKIPAKILFENSMHSQLPPQVDSASSFTFNLGVTGILDAGQFEKLRQEIIADQTAKQAKRMAEQLAKDTVIIDNFLKEKAIVAKKTTSGLRYIVTKEGKGPVAAPGQNVKLEYKGYLLNGKVFDASNAAVARETNVYQEGRPYGPLELQVGARQVIEGWEEAMMLMNKGAKLTVYVPSTLAYGDQRRSAEILENSILVFDMEMVDITK